MKNRQTASVRTGIKFAAMTAALIAALAAPRSGRAATYKDTTLYSFSCTTNQSGEVTGCPNGYYSSGGLIMDAAGNLYGTTEGGGSSPNCSNSYGCGVVFELTPSESGWTETVVYSFCSQVNCTDGLYPLAGLIMDAAGNLYGTTEEGGSNTSSNSSCPASYTGCGVVFELTPNQGGTSWTYSVLYNFCSQSKCTDGALALSGALVMDAAGNLYGTTYNGGSNTSSNSSCPSNFAGCGVVFELTPNQNHTVWTQTVLYNFCSQSNCTDGYAIESGLIMDASGNLYGTTAVGGPRSYGAVFELTPNQGVWTETILHAFCDLPDCYDGRSPVGALVMDSAGNLYGATESGGTYQEGVVYMLRWNGTQWQESVLHNFCSAEACSDGYQPRAGLILGCVSVGAELPRPAALHPFQSSCSQQALIGTTAFGGTEFTPFWQSAGTVFALRPEQGGTWAETVLYNLCSQTDCTDGFEPVAGIIEDAAGNLYGTTAYGGPGVTTTNYGYSVVFKLAPNGNMRPLAPPADASQRNTAIGLH